MKTKGKDLIKLSNGSTMTLKEALDSDLLTLKEERYYDPPRYFARERHESVSWEISKTMYLSRTGQPLPFGK